VCVCVGGGGRWGRLVCERVFKKSARDWEWKILCILETSVGAIGTPSPHPKWYVVPVNKGMKWGLVICCSTSIDTKILRY
jgi:hypothetical protein